MRLWLYTDFKNIKNIIHSLDIGYLKLYRPAASRLLAYTNRRPRLRSYLIS